MTASTASPVAPPRRRWHHSWKLRGPILLLLLCVAAYFVLPWLLIPADLRRIQGTWKIVRIVHRGQEKRGEEVGKLVVISRTHLLIDGDLSWFELRPEQKMLVAYEPESVKVLGIDIQIPIWLRRPESLRNPPAGNVCRYELSESRLIVMMPGDDPENPEDGVEFHLARVP